MSADDFVKVIEAYGKLPVDTASDGQDSSGRSLTTTLLALATLALVGLALVLLFVSSSSDAADLRKTIITALLSILASISGFYFGARTAQHSAQQALAGADGNSPPTFNQATPPDTMTIGQPYTYQFSASGAPPPVYQLLDLPPDWLKIDSTTGLLSGVVPPEQGPSFSFSVEAHNTAGSVRAGPFNVRMT